MTATIYMILFLNIVSGFLLMAERIWKPEGKTHVKKEIGADAIGVAIYVVSGSLIRELSMGLGFSTTARHVYETIGFTQIPRDIAFFLIVDFGSYAIHRYMHSNRIMWANHYLHHTPKYLYCISGLRNSVLQRLIGSLPFMTTAFLIVPSPAAILTVGFLYMFMNLYIHSNLRVWRKVERLFSTIFVTNEFHRVHHSCVSKGRSSNYGAVLSIWDRMFGTALDPDYEKPGANAYGLKRHELSIKTFLGV